MVTKTTTELGERLALITSTVHIVFSPSAAGSLKQALCDAGWEGRVAGYFENLVFGPINPPDLQMRLQWMEEHGYAGGEWGHAEEEAFWKTVLDENVRRVAWTSRRSAPEYCGFLELLWRLRDLPCEVVDIADIPVGSRQRAFSLVQLSPDEVAAIWHRAEALDAITRSHCHDLWRRLRVENEPLRVVDANGLRSAPITFFDQQLLSFAKASWQKPARIIGETMIEWVVSPMGPYFQVGDEILAARIIALVELGVLEGRGNLSDIRQSEVRLCNRAPSGGAGAA